MKSQFRNFRAVPLILFSPGSSRELQNVIEGTVSRTSNYLVYIIDIFFRDGELANRLGITDSDICLFLDTTSEPKTETVDQFVSEIKALNDHLPDVIIGVGGGSTLDVSKAVAIMLTNEGKTEQYQGWDLVKSKPIYKIGIPTLSGTGAEVSRTAVLTGPMKKQGINSDHSGFDQVILDPELLVTVPPQQHFFTGMDCYIHSVEAVTGTYVNEFGKAFAEKALAMCHEIFLNHCSDSELMVASLMGGYSIAYSEVGICHALSYGLSFCLGYHHGEANCIAFSHLDEYYLEHVELFREMLRRHKIQLPVNVVRDIDKATMEKMVDMTLLMERPLDNALGSNWREILTREKIKELYRRM
jgi:3-deoxy-alpha-D-manno-octulosonate 8-oxidase